MAEIKGDSPKVFHRWRPIEPIDSTNNHAYDFGEIDSLQREWLRIKQEVEGSSPNAYKAFTERLNRRWSIETGIIEGIYDLDRGVTETLIERGIATEYIERGSTNKEPAELVQILNDHQDSVASVNYWIEQGRPLTKNFIKSLHNQILNSQHTHTAINQFGSRFEATLRKGEFKTQPNNPTRPDGAIHEYCPPEQVESELDNLLSMYERYDKEGCHPLLLAAWLHHRFTQVHPFADGNGRVGRAILTWHLVKNRYFPVVVSRDDRAEYIGVLEKADAGDLAPVIDLIADLEKTTILQVIDEGRLDSQPELEPEGDLVDQVVDSIVDRAKRRTLTESEQMRSVNHLASVLQEEARIYLTDKSQEIKEKLSAARIHMDFNVELDETERFGQFRLRSRIGEIGKWLPYPINFYESGYSMYLLLKPISGRQYPNFMFVISWHHTGNQLTGIMAAAAFAEIGNFSEYFAVGQPDSLRYSTVSTFHNCTVTPFTFTWRDSAEEISDRFIKWTEACLSIALRHWMENS